MHDAFAQIGGPSVTGAAGDIGRAICSTLWLASPAGAFVTGQTMVVDGGTLISDGS